MKNAPDSLPTSLSYEEVQRIVGEYESEEVTQELRRFGEMLVNETEERTRHLDSKATLIVGYGGAILAFMLTRPVSDIPRNLLFYGIVILAALAVVYAFVALRARDWLWFSESDWFRADMLDSPEKLSRFYLVAMYGVRHNNHELNNVKADRVILAQWLLAGAAGVLALQLIFGPRLVALLNRLGVWAGNLVGG